MELNKHYVGAKVSAFGQDGSHSQPCISKMATADKIIPLLRILTLKL